MIDSKRYKDFLESESRKAPIEKKQIDEGRRFWVYWTERDDKVVGEGETRDIIDLVYFDKKPSKTVILDRSTARILQERLKGLEEENIDLLKKMRVMKSIICALTLVITALLIILFWR